MLLVADYINSRANEQQRRDCKAVIALLKKVTGKPPKMWGPSIIGFGSYKYTYDSGHSGEFPVTGLAIRGRDLVVYLMAEGDKGKSLRSKLGKHSMGKSCLYFRQLADLDVSVLEKLVAHSIEGLRRRYPQHNGA